MDKDLYHYNNLATSAIALLFTLLGKGFYHLSFFYPNNWEGISYEKPS